MTQQWCGCQAGPSGPAFPPSLPAPHFPPRSSVPRCGGAPWSSHRSRSQAQGPRYVTGMLETHDGNVSTLKPLRRGVEVGLGTLGSRPSGWAPPCSSLGTAG